MIFLRVRYWLLVIASLILGTVGRTDAAFLPISPGDFASNATIITFETGSTGLPTVPGAIFDLDRPGAPELTDSSSNFQGFFGAQGWSNLVGSRYTDLSLTFTTPVQAVGGYLGQIRSFTGRTPSTVTVELFASQFVSLGSASINIPPAFNSPVFFGFTSDIGISRLEIRVNNGGFIGADNITFGELNPAAVPEPSSLALCGIAAFVGLGYARSRGKRAAAA